MSAYCSDPAQVTIRDRPPRFTEISRGASGDCCVLCGAVGINLPDDHGCQPNIDVEAYRAQPRLDWDDLWRREVRQIAVTNQSNRPAIQGHHAVAVLAGLAAKVASTPEPGRQSITWWAGCRAAERGFPDEAFEVLADAARSTGLPESEIRKALRMRPGRKQVA